MNLLERKVEDSESKGNMDQSNWESKETKEIILYTAN